jgi:hypothetical protein
LSAPPENTDTVLHSALALRKQPVPKQPTSLSKNGVR